MKYKLIALDIDGTLITQDRQITPRTKRAIQKIRQLGVEVTLCTGRMLAATTRFAKELDITSPLVTYNGGLVKYHQGQKVIYQQTLAGESANFIIKEARKKGFPIHFYYDDRLIVEKITEGSKEYAEYSEVSLEKVEDLLALPYDPLKLLVIGEPADLEAFEQECKERFEEEIYITKSWPVFLEFLDPKANKGQGLKELADYLNIRKEEIVVIGDNYNDLPMFDYAGLRVAMGNGEDILKEAADYITGTNEEDGVAQVLEKLIDGQASLLAAN